MSPALCNFNDEVNYLHLYFFFIGGATGGILQHRTPWNKMEQDLDLINYPITTLVLEILAFSLVRDWQNSQQQWWIGPHFLLEALSSGIAPFFLLSLFHRIFLFNLLELNWYDSEVSRSNPTGTKGRIWVIIEGRVGDTLDWFLFRLFHVGSHSNLCTWRLNIVT